MMTAFELGLDAIDVEIGPSPSEPVELIAAKCRGLLHGYDARWHDSGHTPVSVERW